ncbi:Gfo/Idh/MocA family oxidoreductase [Pirellulales bacterium]|nr:Gfo/Idh/MocA family oxidoreductase [Pirellulales bacterium]
MCHALVNNPQDIRLGMAGRVAGNDHPFSWSAIINGYDVDALKAHADPVISEYLGAQPTNAIGIDGVQVTHVWCDHEEDARQVAASSLIPHVVDRPEAMLGEVDAVLIPTDVGGEHLERARPFVEANLPVFIDKPLTDRPDHLQQFQAWIDSGRPILSGSALRYTREFEELREGDLQSEIGSLRLVTFIMCNSWLRYGMHALEAVYPFLNPGGWLSIRDSGRTGAHVLHARHKDDVDVVFMLGDGLLAASGALVLYGSDGSAAARFEDRFYPFRRQLDNFVHWLRTGQAPFPFSQTCELTRLLIGGETSLREGGRLVVL